MLELCESESDEFPEKKLHQIFPTLKECIVCPRTNRKEETVKHQLLETVGNGYVNTNNQLYVTIGNGYVNSETLVICNNK